MSAKSSSSAFPTNALHSALIGIVLSLAVFRFFIQGEFRYIPLPTLLAAPDSALSRAGERCSATSRLLQERAGAKEYRVCLRESLQVVEEGTEGQLLPSFSQTDVMAR